MSREGQHVGGYGLFGLILLKTFSGMVAMLPEAAATMAYVAALSESIAFRQDGFAHEIDTRRERLPTNF